MHPPSWLLLFWCGTAATCAAAVTGTLLGDEPRAWSLAPGPRSLRHALSWTVVAGVLAYPLLYGVAFETMRAADLRAGIVIGMLHGLIAFIAARPTHHARAAITSALAHVAYAITFAVLYVTP